MLRFDDTKGDEQVFIRARKNCSRRVENDDVLTVMHDQAIVIHNNRDETVEEGHDNITLLQGNRSIDIWQGSQTTEAMQSITLKVGQSSIVIDQTGVYINGMMISIQGQVQTQVQGTMTQIQGDAMVQVGGGVIMIG